MSYDFSIWPMFINKNYSAFEEVTSQVDSPTG